MELKEGNALVLRACSADMSSQNGFVWPGVGEEAIAPDWNRNAECGNGLHGWLYGQGDHRCSSYMDETVKWLAVEVVLSDVVMLGGKVKFERGIVRFVGGPKEAADFVLKHEPQALNGSVIGACLVVGDEQAVQVGALGMATAGGRGTATAGDGGTATAGDGGTATAGDGGTATAGDRGTATAGYSGTATAGHSGTATAGDRGTATAGYSGTATAGYGGTATAGDRGTATAGDGGTATAGYRGEIRIRWYENKINRERTVIGYIGEGGLLANTAYQLNDKQEFVLAASPASPHR